jgi:DNA-binding MarR family transcriptional regulator
MSAKRRPALKFDPTSPAWIGLRLAVISNRYAGALYSEIDDQLDLQRDDVAVMVCLSITTASTAQEIVRYTGRPKNSISRAVSGLEADGFLRRTTHPHDSRAVTLTLTAKGRRMAEQLAGRAARHDARLLADLSGAEQHELIRLLNSLADSSLNLDEAPAESAGARLAEAT